MPKTVVRTHPPLALALLAALVVAVTHLPGERAEPTPAFDRYGGNTAIKGEATGFFHLKKVGDRHFLVTPDGHGYRALGINHFHKMTSNDLGGAIANIRNWGFNAGCYQGPRWMWKRFPYTKGINLVPNSQWKPDGQFAFKDVFDPAFLTELEQHIRRIAAPQRDNPMLIGYFWTDIPLWEKKRDGTGWIEFYQALPDDAPGRQVWQDWKRDNPSDPEDVFLAVIAKHLYAKAHAFLRQHDPNHLLFGDRYHEIDMPDHVVRESLPYVDAIAVQPTSREFNHGFFANVYSRYGKPVYIADHVSSFATEQHPVTMGQATKDPQSYVAYYERYVTAALAQPYLIGYNKCQYQDEIARGPMLKQGLLRQDESPYPTISGITAANKKALQLAYATTTAPSAAAGTVCQETADHLVVTRDGKHVLTYHKTAKAPDGVDPKYARSGFIHPLSTPSGKVVTDGYPVPHHAHQHGLFFAWKAASFRGEKMNFWEPGAQSIRHDGVLEVINTPEAAGFRVKLAHLDGDTRVLSEFWTVLVDAETGHIDLLSNQYCATASPLTVTKHHYGGMAVRGSRGWFRDAHTEAGKGATEDEFVAPCTILTSEGLTQKNGNHSRPEWVAMTGPVDGEPVTLTLIPHPTNFRHPQHVRLHPEMPYFCFIPTVEEPFTLATYRPLTSRFRIVAEDGAPDPDQLNTLQKSFAAHP